jgi:hypothetical protein
MSFLPPATTIRRYQRTTLATTSGEIGAIYCAILSFASSRREEDVEEIVTSLIAIRSKLRRSVILRTNAIYEVGQGSLPVEHLLKNSPVLFERAMACRKIPEHPGDTAVRPRAFVVCLRYHLTPLSSQITYALNHLMSVVKHLEPAWARALLRRTRFLDTDFQGDILAVISELCLC